MFDHLERVPDDPILGLMAAFRSDSDARKVDLGVGVFRNELGETPVPLAVRHAEQRVLEKQRTKAYVSPSGNPGFNQAIEELVFGSNHAARRGGRVRTLQTPGGCGALRLGADLLRVAMPEATALVSTPTWANHVPLLGGAGLRLERYPYYDATTGGVLFPQMLDTLSQQRAGTVVLLHACCHNPTGADLSTSQWQEVCAVMAARGLVPYIDLAYQGLGSGLDEDAYAVRLLTAELPEVLVSVSCSKNFGLYRERTGALHVIAATARAADATISQVIRIARTSYSMPPDHGAAIVHEILSDTVLRNEWANEVSAMRSRIGELRRALVARLATAQSTRDFGFIARQQGMFSYLGISPAQVQALRTDHHVYMTDDARINIAGLCDNNLGYFSSALCAVL